MRPKIIIGIFLPLAIIIALVALSSSDIGFSVESKSVDSVRSGSLFVSQSDPKENIEIQTINIVNDYFLPKKFELPGLVACLNDKESKKEPQGLQLRFTQGQSSGSPGVPIYDGVMNYYPSSSRQTIDLPQYSTRTVKVLVQPVYVYNYIQEIESYRGYDEILLIESKDNNFDYYNTCSSLDSEELGSAVHIVIS